MKPNNIAFADLSTYTPDETSNFYHRVFQWEYHKHNNYYLAHRGSDITTRMYETPDKFKTIGMPHFWMTYIQVNDLDKTVQLAKDLGGIIELVDKDSSIGAIALIRDPLGAGFTIFEGDILQNTRTKNIPNTLIWNELHVSDISKVLPFYSEIFNWRFTKKANSHYEIYNYDGNHISDILEIENRIKGKYEYWVCTFGVKDLEQTQKLIEANGGSCLYDSSKRALCSDNSEQAFFFIKQVD